MTTPTTDSRLSKLELGFAGVQRDVGVIASDFRAFSDEYRKDRDKANNDRANMLQAGRITLPQIVAMAASMFTMAAILIGGGMVLVRSESNATRLEIQGETAKIALQLRGQQDSLIAAQNSLQALQRDIGGQAVKLGLVEQSAARNVEQLKELSSYDAHLARLEERVKALVSK